MIPLYTHALAAIAGAAIAAGAAWQVQDWRYTARLETITAAHANERANQAAQVAVLTVQHRETEQALTAQAENIQEQTHAQISSLAGQRDDLARRLRAQSASAATARLVSATAHTPGHAAPAGGDYGAVLSEQAGDDLVSEAYRADTIRISLAACYRQYDAARTALSAEK